MYLPWFWMRSDEKVGLLPPDVAYRGQDGFFAGGGVHLPWKDRGVRQALDLRGGGYLEGGFVADVRLRSPIAATKIRFDRLPGARAPVLLVPGPLRRTRTTASSSTRAARATAAGRRSPGTPTSSVVVVASRRRASSRPRPSRGTARRRRARSTQDRSWRRRAFAPSRAVAATSSPSRPRARSPRSNRRG